MIRLGIANGHPSAALWRDMGFPVDWVEDDLPSLLTSGLLGVFTDPEKSEQTLPLLSGLPRVVDETRFVDFIELASGRPWARSSFRSAGAEFLGKGVPSLSSSMRAYVAGSGPWARLFALLAVEHGFRQLRFVVEDPAEVQDLIRELNRFCFGVEIQALPHVELTLQPNNGSLLVNTLASAENAELVADLAYLNFISPEGLVVDVHEQDNLLLSEAKGSQIRVLDGAATQAFAEYKSLSQIRGLLTGSFEDYLEMRKSRPSA